MRWKFENPIVVEHHISGLPQMKRTHDYFTEPEADSDACKDQDQPEENLAHPGAEPRRLVAGR